VSDTILAQDHGTWVEITLNRPDRLNSFNDEMHLALRAALEGARDSGARCVLLTGAGRGFCAGQDLGDRDPSKMEGRGLRSNQCHGHSCEFYLDFQLAKHGKTH
jgi:2-(1,2-epoxy-1,2-dihydrophenyl)acetyl-CoA isomerase